MSFAKELSDERIIDLIWSYDCLSKPNEERQKDDIEALDALCGQLSIAKDIATKIILMAEVMREAVKRGIKVSRLADNENI